MSNHLDAPAYNSFPGVRFDRYRPGYYIFYILPRGKARINVIHVVVQASPDISIGIANGIRIEVRNTGIRTIGPIATDIEGNGAKPQGPCNDPACPIFKDGL